MKNKKDFSISRVFPAIAHNGGDWRSKILALTENGFALMTY
jgi:hypothetical protein